MKYGGKTMRKTIKLLLFTLIIAAGTVGVYKSYADTHLTEHQQKVADIVAQVTIDNFDTYRIYPALTVGIAMQESSLGVHCPSYNLFGIKSGKERYASYEEATVRVLNVLNNGYYPTIPNNADYKDCAKKLNGVYCVGDAEYHNKLIRHIEKYNFTKYNEKLNKIQAKKRLKKLRKQRFCVVVDKSLKDTEVAINKEVAGKCNTVTIYNDNVLVGIYDIKIRDTIGTDTIAINNTDVKSKKITMQFYNAKG